ncbi:MAG: pirin family protein [Planctomycetota bacterium]
MNLSRRDVMKTAAAAAGAAGLSACAGGVKARPDALGAALPPGGAPVPPEAMRVRPAAERGGANHGWLDTKHSFSFADYYDPRHMGFRALRVINEDFIAAGEGFPMHPHRDMEIITYVLSGALEHRDTLGNGGVIRPDTLQRMSAGRGIRHSEFNPMRDERVHMLQIWIEPDTRGVEPGYGERAFPLDDRTNRLRLVASPDGADGSLRIHASTRLHASILEPGRTVVHAVEPGRHAWLQVARGALDVNGTPLVAGDGLAVSAAGLLEMKARAAGAEVLVFDLA